MEMAVAAGTGCVQCFGVQLDGVHAYRLCCYLMLASNLCHSQVNLRNTPLSQLGQEHPMIVSPLCVSVTMAAMSWAY